MKPNVKVIKKWVKALRSGKYKQTKGRLRRSEDAFCCLGVLCDLNEKEGGGKWRMTLGAGYLFGPKNGSSFNDVYLPKFVAKWAGILPSAEIQKVEPSTLATMNDLGSNFKQIAAFIEENCLKPKKKP